MLSFVISPAQMVLSPDERVKGSSGDPFHLLASTADYSFLEVLTSCIITCHFASAALGGPMVAVGNDSPLVCP